MILKQIRKSLLEIDDSTEQQLKTLVKDWDLVVTTASTATAHKCSLKKALKDAFSCRCGSSGVTGKLYDSLKNDRVILQTFLIM